MSFIFPSLSLSSLSRRPRREYPCPVGLQSCRETPQPTSAVVAARPAVCPPPPRPLSAGRVASDDDRPLSTTNIMQATQRCASAAARASATRATAVRASAGVRRAAAAPAAAAPTRAFHAAAPRQAVHSQAKPTAAKVRHTKHGKDSSGGGGAMGARWILLIRVGCERRASRETRKRGATDATRSVGLRDQRRATRHRHTPDTRRTWTITKINANHTRLERCISSLQCMLTDVLPSPSVPLLVAFFRRRPVAARTR